MNSESDRSCTRTCTYYTPRKLIDLFRFEKGAMWFVEIDFLIYQATRSRPSIHPLTFIPIFPFPQKKRPSAYLACSFDILWFSCLGLGPSIFLARGNTPTGCNNYILSTSRELSIPIYLTEPALDPLRRVSSLEQASTWLDET